MLVSSVYYKARENIMDIFQKNMNYLEHASPMLYDKINSADIDFSCYAIEPLWGNYNNVIYSMDKGSYAMYDKENSISDIQCLLKEADEEKNVIFYGLGLGYHVFELLKLKNVRSVIIIEPDIRNLMLFMSLYDLEKFMKSEKIDLLVSNDAEEICSTLVSNYTAIFNDKLKVETFSFYESLYKEDYRRFLQRFIIEYSNRVADKATKLVRIEQFIRNGIYNFVSYVEDSILVDSLFDIYKDIPAIIVGAGPSLNKQLEALKEVKNKAVVFAVGSGMNVLDQNDIKHHFKVAIDSDSGSGEARYFKELKDKNVDIIYAPSLHFKALDGYKGNKFYTRAAVQTEYTYLEEIVGLNTDLMYGGGTVSMISVDIAKKMGCNPIILLGQDFAYTNLQNYANGAVNKKDITSDFKNLIEKRDIYGNPIYTKEGLYSLKLGFDIFIADHTKKWEAKIYNCTEGGIGIEGIENASFKEILAKYCQWERDITVSPEKLEKIKFEGDSNLIWMKQYEEAKQISKILDNALKLINKMSSSIQKGRNDRKLQKYNDNLKEELCSLDDFKLFSHWIVPLIKTRLSLIDSLYEKEYSLEEDIWKQQKNFIAMMKMQYEQVQKMCEFIIRVIEATYENRGMEIKNEE